MLAKPIGPICNLDCKYCFYLEKENLYEGEQDWKMDPELLERYIQMYIEGQDIPHIAFAWQGGEPTLLGVDFFRRVVELQKKHCPPGKEISNALQTNGTLLNDEWCSFFKEHNFLIGLSVDGPADLHNQYRVDKGGNDTHDKVLRGANFLKKHEVEFNALCVVNRYNAREPLRVYHFLKELGTNYFQFIPIAEREGDEEAVLDLSLPPQLQEQAKVTGWSVHSEDYGDFLNTIFDEWVRNDIGTYYIQLFDVQLEIRFGNPASLCIYRETCGDALAIEHNGDFYSCDHYVYPEYHLGNIKDNSLREMADLQKQKDFGNTKKDSLPRECRECEFLKQCNGECPKNRFLTTLDGEPGLNYLCKGLKKFFRHTNPYFDRMVDLLRERRPPAELMMHLQREEEQYSSKKNNANDLCPCGSGKKFKRCHGRGA
ncbi:MAG: anaerobic sulfatase-maturation protein [Planctomycetes bacterium]|nr:anaerobic sulfatase-maturation protein [Planctomycetota bacterium]